MAKAARLILVLGALAVFGLFDFVSTLATCQQPNTEEQKQRSGNSCGFADSLTYRAGEYVTEWIDRRHDFVTAAATVVIALFTIALWRATDRLWGAGERQLDHLTESSERRLRAYIFPVEAVLTKFSAGQSVECKIVTKNSGQTPAYRLTHAAMIGLVNFPPKGPFPECVASQALSQTNLGPGATIDKFGQRDAPMSEADLSEVKVGSAAIYLFGRIDFIDAFGRPRWVKYRFMTGGSAGFEGKGRLAICPDGNETSEDEDIQSKTSRD